MTEISLQEIIPPKQSALWYKSSKFIPKQMRENEIGNFDLVTEKLHYLEFRKSLRLGR